jgi:hypothetical protein
LYRVIPSHTVPSISSRKRILFSFRHCVPTAVIGAARSEVTFTATLLVVAMVAAVVVSVVIEALEAGSVRFVCMLGSLQAGVW